MAGSALVGCAADATDVDGAAAATACVALIAWAFLKGCVPETKPSDPLSLRAAAAAAGVRTPPKSRYAILGADDDDDDGDDGDGAEDLSTRLEAADADADAEEGVRPEPP